MTALVILLSILLLLVLLLCAPLSLRTSFTENGTTLRLHYLFFRFSLSERLLQEKPPKKERKPPAEKPPKEEKEKKPGVLLSDAWDVIKGSRRGLAFFRRHLVFSRVQLYVSVAAGDAHRTALLYGQISAIARVCVQIIEALFVLRRPDVVIRPNFCAQKTRYDLSLQISVRPLFLLAALIVVLFPFLMRIVRNKRRPPSGSAAKQT